VMDKDNKVKLVCMLSIQSSLNRNSFEIVFLTFFQQNF